MGKNYLPNQRAFRFVNKPISLGMDMSSFVPSTKEAMKTKEFESFNLNDDNLWSTHCKHTKTFSSPKSRSLKFLNIPISLGTCTIWLSSEKMLVDKYWLATILSPTHATTSSPLWNSLNQKSSNFSTNPISLGIDVIILSSTKQWLDIQYVRIHMCIKSREFRSWCVGTLLTQPQTC